jgi:glycosyltransferase 2 family protein
LKKKLLDALKIILPLGLGLYLVWFFYSSLSEQDKVDIASSFQSANYTWVLFSLFFGLLSHLSRAYRWSYTLEPLGYKTRFWNNFFAVMIAYLVNLAVPRLGELSRCGVTARYEKVPFNKLLGTVIAERVADFIILILITVSVVFIQFEIIKELIFEIVNAITEKVSGIALYGFVGVLLLGILAFVYFFFLDKKEHPFIDKLKGIIVGLYEGVASIFKMKKKWQFLGHTAFIWVMYLLMFYLCFFSLPETKDVPIGGILTAFVLGGFTIVLTNGGIGAYPLAIQAVLLLYGVDKNTGAAFGWIVWTAQTLMLVIFGAISFVLMPIYNKRIAHAEA